MKPSNEPPTIRLVQSSVNAPVVGSMVPVAAVPEPSGLGAPWLNTPFA